MFCHKCGNKSPESAEFCHKCGTRMVSTGDATQDGNETTTLPTTSATSKRTPLGWFTGSRFGIAPVWVIGLMLGVWIGGTGGTIILWTVVAIQLLKVGLCIKAFTQPRRQVTIGGIIQDIVIALVLLLLAVGLPSMFEEAGHGQQQGQSQTQQTTTGQQQTIGTIGDRIVIDETQSFNSAGYGNLEVTLNYAEFSDRIEDLFRGGYIFPDEGNIFLNAELTIENIGTESGTLPTAWTTIIYDGAYEFRHHSLDGDFTVNPLSPPATGVVIFILPSVVAESDGSLVLNFDGMTGNSVSFVIRQGVGILESPQSVTPQPTPQSEIPQPTPQTQVDTTGWVTITHPVDRYRFDMPASWSYDLLEGTDMVHISSSDIGIEWDDYVIFTYAMPFDELELDLDYRQEEIIDWRRFQFDDGNNGYFHMFEDNVLWSNVTGSQDLHIMFVHYGNTSIYYNNEDVLSAIARSLRW